MDMLALIPFFSGITALGVICGAVWFTVQQAINPIKTEISHLKSEIEEIKTTRKSDEAHFSKKLDDILQELKEIRKDMFNNYTTKTHCETVEKNTMSSLTEIKDKLKNL